MLTQANYNQTLAKPLRSQLENTVKAAREIAEKGAQAALHQLALGASKAPDFLNEEQKALRRRLRSHGRAIGDAKQDDDTQTIQHLIWEVAYEHWHRMLFARFLAENGLLLWMPGAPVTLDECNELVQDSSTNLGAKTGWELASKLAAKMLPQVFKPKHPVFDISFAPEYQRALENLLADLATEVFTASDSLGWVYQFWQAKRKDEVNASEVKIGADELPAVTQLFTEPYMVDFLLHNSLGAWWRTRYPDQTCPVNLNYLRTLEDGTPAAGKFEAWPNTLAQFKLLDPCCGSGHFLVAAFLMLVPMRMATEGLNAPQAIDAVLKDNLFGLELDARCVEIAVFALALAAWRFTDENGNPLGVRPQMPSPNIACCGLKVAASAKDWENLVPLNANNAQFLRQELGLLHSCFEQAPLLGSLLDPARTLKQDLASSNFGLLQELLEQALANETPSMNGGSNPGTENAWDLALTARGLLDAARLLDARYHLVITNVPYLARGKQHELLKKYCQTHYDDAKNDLANVFLERCLELSLDNGLGVVQVVMPQNWLFLGSYKKQRESLLKSVQWNLLARLGEGGFDSPQAAGAFIILLTQTRTTPNENCEMSGIDASIPKVTQEKALLLCEGELVTVSQQGQLGNPDARVAFELTLSSNPLNKFARIYQGIGTSDASHFIQKYWEGTQTETGWIFYQMAPESDLDISGMHSRLLWCNGGGPLALVCQKDAQYRGKSAWGKRGVSLGVTRGVKRSEYFGAHFDCTFGALVPLNDNYFPAIYAYALSEEFVPNVRKLDQALSITETSFGKVPFDLAHWQAIAAERYPNGLPKPFSNDPTQWLFHGHPQVATDPLQVAIVRLVGYRWPAESDTSMELSDEAKMWITQCKKLEDHTDDDGIVCLPSVRGEPAAHDRLLQLLISAWESVEPGSWSPSVLEGLLSQADCAGKNLELWLREKFFEQHAKLFHHRPFIWHVWDGLKDGFSALLNYHKLDQRNLEKLIHTYLGDWIRSQEAGVAAGTDGATLRLSAALALKKKLEAIQLGQSDGKQGYDIFVRWKPLTEQAIGWSPDLNDGVRMNIRPFMTAEVLRHNKKPKLNISWEKDRGKDVEGAPWFHLFKGERINDHHLTIEEKQMARNQMKGA